MSAPPQPQSLRHSRPTPVPRPGPAPPSSFRRRTFSSAAPQPRTPLLPVSCNTPSVNSTPSQGSDRPMVRKRLSFRVSSSPQPDSVARSPKRPRAMPPTPQPVTLAARRLAATLSQVKDDAASLPGTDARPRQEIESIRGHALKLTAYRLNTPETGMTLCRVQDTHPCYPMLQMNALVTLKLAPIHDQQTGLVQKHGSRVTVPSPFRIVQNDGALTVLAAAVSIRDPEETQEDIQTSQEAGGWVFGRRAGSDILDRFDRIGNHVLKLSVRASLQKASRTTSTARIQDANGCLATVQV